MPAPHGITTIGEIRKAIECLPDDAIAVVDLWTSLDIRQHLADWIRYEDEIDGVTVPIFNVNDPKVLRRAAQHIPTIAWNDNYESFIDSMTNGFREEFMPEEAQR